MATTADILPMSDSRAAQVFEFLAKAPRTSDEIARVAFSRWHNADPESAKTRAQDLLEQLRDQGRVRENADGKFEAVPENDEDRDEQGELRGAEPTGGPAESNSTEQPTVAKRGRKPGTKNKPKDPDSNGAGKPEATKAAAPAAEKAKPKAQGSVLRNEEISDHLGAIDRVEQELAAAKIGYEDYLNIRRMKRAALDVAKSERRRYSVHEGSGLEAIKSAQKAVDKATKQYNEAAANALEGKNKVASIEEKLSRTIAGEMPLFNEGEEGDGGEE